MATFGFNRTTRHTAEATLDVLCHVFEDRIISRRADVVCPPRSCHLTPLDYYLSGAVTDKCYADKPEIIKDHIREATGDIQLHTIDNVLKNWADRVGYCTTDFFAKLFMAILFILKVFARNLLRGNRRRNTFRIPF